jgi:signal transduction histidine kinase
VHGARGLALELRVPGALRFRGDPGDLTEILGNLLDNAFKWAGSRVRVSAAEAGGALVLAVEDDGPGLPAELAAAVTGRGVRLDPSMEGHGVGLAVVRSIVTEGYGGDLRLIPSDLGGLRAEAHLPL